MKISKVVVPSEEIDVPIRGIDINTGEEIDVVFAGNITDPVVETFPHPKIEVPKDIPYSISREHNFTHLDNPSKHMKSRCNQWLLDETKKDDDVVRTNVTIKSVKSLLGQNYLKDEIIDYCSKHLGTLFCGDVSPYSTFIFPINFTHRLMNMGHTTMQYALDVNKGVHIAENLSHGKNLMEYDHLIAYNNPGTNHWNTVVIFPKDKKIEMFDSIGVYDPTPLVAVWHFLVAYCRQTSEFDPEGWKLYVNRPGVAKQTDHFNCGLFVILYSVAIHHRNDLNKISSDHCNRLRRYLIHHFMRDATEGQRLTQAWNKEYPVPAPALAGSSESVTPEKSAPIVTQMETPQEKDVSSKWDKEEHLETWFVQMVPNRSSK